MDSGLREKVRQVKEVLARIADKCIKQQDLSFSFFDQVNVSPDNFPARSLLRGGGVGLRPREGTVRTRQGRNLSEKESYVSRLHSSCDNTCMAFRYYTTAMSRFLKAKVCEFYVTT